MDLDLGTVFGNWTKEETDRAETQTRKMSRQGREAQANIHVEEGAVGCRCVP